MKKIILSVLLLILFNSAFAQVWYKSYGNEQFNAGEDVATDASGNIYVTGYFWGTFNISTTTLISKGGQDIFLGKWDNYGNFLWARGIGSASSDEGRAIYVDPSGNSYISGIFSNTVSFGSYTLDSHDGNMFLAKYDKDGTCLWAYGYGNSSDSRVYGICSDGTNLYMVGYFHANASFGSTTLIRNGLDDIFIAKFNTNGTCLWAENLGGTGNDACYGNSICYAGGNLYITGFFDGSMSAGSTTLTSHGSSDIFIAKLDTSGAIAWATSAGGLTDDNSVGITTDAAGNVYIRGSFTNNAVFGTTIYTANTNTNEDQFYAKYDVSGSFVSLYDMGDGSYGSDLLVDSKGKVYASGDLYAPSTGVDRYSAGLCFDLLGNVISTGSWQSSSDHHWNLFVAKYAAPTAVSAVATSGNLAVYPNPASSGLSIKGLRESGPIELCDVTGRVVLRSVAHAKEMVMNIAALSPGMYILSTSEGRMKITKK